MNTNINDILVEWAYRVKDGKPNPKSIGDRIVLESVLKDFGWNIIQRDELLKNLTEIAPTDMVSNPNPKGRAKKVQYQYAKQWMDDNPDAETSDDFKKDVGQEKADDSEAETQSQEVDRSKFDKKQKIYKDAPNARTQAEGLESLNAGNLDYVNEYQNEA